MVIVSPAGANRDCSDRRVVTLQEFYSYVKQGGHDPDSYTIGGIGNSDYYLDLNMEPISPEELVRKASVDSRLKSAKKIILAWPYSSSGEAPYARAVERLTGKPVIGFSGPLWSYPDGSMISTKAGSDERPSDANIGPCMTSDEKYHEAKECRALLRTHLKEKALSGNDYLILGCEEEELLRAAARKGDAGANMTLFRYYAFVAFDDKSASEHLHNAAAEGSPTASHFLANYHGVHY